MPLSSSYLLWYTVHPGNVNVASIEKKWNFLARKSKVEALEFIKRWEMSTPAQSCCRQVSQMLLASWIEEKSHKKSATIILKQLEVVAVLLHHFFLYWRRASSLEFIDRPSMVTENSFVWQTTDYRIQYNTTTTIHTSGGHQHTQAITRTHS
jgi:hypothetical protein